MRLFKICNGVAVSSCDVTNFEKMIKFISRSVNIRGKYNGKQLEFVFWEHDNDLRIGYFSVRVSYNDDVVTLEQCAKILAQAMSRKYQEIHTPNLAVDSDVDIDESKLKVSKEGASSAPPFFDTEFHPEYHISMKKIRENLGISQEEWDSRHSG